MSRWHGGGELVMEVWGGDGGCSVEEDSSRPNSNLSGNVMAAVIWLLALVHGD